MRQKSGGVDRILKYSMAVVGILLILLLLGKAAGMGSWGTEKEKSGATGKYKAAECLQGLLNYSYPVKSAAQQIELEQNGGQVSLMSKWITWAFKQNPTYRYAQKAGADITKTSSIDPAYEKYQKNQEFYQEHQYLMYYGDEESNQEFAEEINQPQTAPVQVASVEKNQAALPVVGTQYVMEQLMDYDFLMKNFYIVHSSTTATREEMQAKKLLNTDLSISKNENEPQILIYHTHSQETFADYGPDNPDATVVGIGSYLTELLQAKGYQVIHHKGVYDFKDGELDRSKAYTYALDGVTEILQQNPSIQVVLDIHRDGVREGVHLVSEVNGKQTAQIMFFNGMSQTPSGTIEHLQNPYKEENLAFTLQMQLKAASYFPGYTRKIYLKGLRYNLHLRPRSALIEVGAQTNTYEEARNAMEPLAELLDMVLQGE